MKKQLLLSGLFLISSLSFGQYVQDAPWMSLLKDNSTSQENTIQDYTLEELNEAFETYWQQKENDPEQKGSGFKPYMRWSNYWQYHLNEDGKIKSPSQLWSSYINKINSENVPNETSDWQNFGPVNVSRLNGATPGIGRINQMAVDPTNDQVWYAGAPSGGIWKTTDGGLNWTPLFDEFPQIGVSGIVQTGASIALNGTCLTVTSFTDTLVSFDLIMETLRVTNLGTLSVGDEVNFERAARFGDEIGGHILSGHIHDQVCIERIEHPENNCIIWFKAPEQWQRYIFAKGFIGLNGCSLTVGELQDNLFNVFLIPETLSITTFQALTVGAKVNVEIDSHTQAVVDTVEQYLQQR